MKNKTATLLQNLKQLIKMLLQIFYMCQKGPKKLREIRECHDIYKEAMIFGIARMKPPKASGTPWISHKYHAMKMFLNKCGIYMQHLESLWKPMIELKKAIWTNRNNHLSYYCKLCLLNFLKPHPYFHFLFKVKSWVKVVVLP